MGALLGARDPAKGHAAAAALADAGFDVQCVPLDVVDPGSVLALVRDLGGSVEVLVNNAGVDYNTDQSAQSADLVRVRRTFETNLSGAWAAAQTFALGMRTGLGRYRQREQRRRPTASPRPR